MSLICSKGCCTLHVTNKIVKEPYEYIIDKTYRIRSGIFLIDDRNRVLLSQSYNSYWGIPKGAKENNETNEETGIRELKEETGVSMNVNLLKNSAIKMYILFKKLYIIFVKNLTFCEFNNNFKVLEPDKLYNETTGCGWINIECLYEMHTNNIIKLNLITRLLLNHYTSKKWTTT